MTTPLLAVRGVSTFYGKIQALRNVDMDVADGEIVTLIGANGAGKLTLMMTIFGNPRAREGSIVFDGRDITRLPTHERALGGIGYAPEDAGIFPDLTVAENFQISQSLAAGNRGMGAGIDPRVFELFPEVRDFIGRRGLFLSGGQRRWSP